MIPLAIVIIKRFKITLIIVSTVINYVKWDSPFKVLIHTAMWPTPKACLLTFITCGKASYKMVSRGQVVLKVSLPRNSLGSTHYSVGLCVSPGEV